MFCSRSLRKDQVTAAAVSSVRLRCSISARATGNVLLSLPTKVMPPDECMETVSQTDLSNLCWILFYWSLLVLFPSYCTNSTMLPLAHSAFFFPKVTSWSWWSSLKRRTNSTWCLKSLEEVSELQLLQDACIRSLCLFLNISVMHVCIL